MKRQHPLGFSLLETLIAMIILTNGVLLLSNSWSGNFMRVRKTKTIEEISSLLERKMTEIEIQYQNNMNELKEEESGDFGSEYPQYSWQMESKDFEMPDLSAALTSQEGGADEFLLMMVKIVQDYIGKAVKEVTVTLIAKYKEKEKKYSLTTYFIDFEKEIPFSGVPSMPGATANEGGPQ